MCLLGEPTLTPPACTPRHPSTPAPGERQKEKSPLLLNVFLLIYTFSCSPSRHSPLLHVLVTRDTKGMRKTRMEGKAWTHWSSSQNWWDPLLYPEKSQFYQPHAHLRGQVPGSPSPQVTSTLFKDTFFPAPWELLVSQQGSLGASEWSPSRHSLEWLCLFELEPPGPLKRERGWRVRGCWYPQL